MDWRAYGNNKYPTYTNVPAQEGGYAHGPKQPDNWYVVETTTIERIRTPATRYINFGDQQYNHGSSTLINPKYAPKNHHEDHDPSTLVSPKYAPKNHHEDHDPSMLISPKYAPKNHREDHEPDYGSDDEKSSPPRHHGRESLMGKFLNKVQTKGSPPVKTSDLSSPNTYKPTSPMHKHPSEGAHQIKTQNSIQATSPERNYPPEAHMIRNKSLPGPHRYKSSSPERSYPTDKANHIRPNNFPGPNKYQPTSPMPYPSEETHLNRTRNLSGPNMYQPTNLLGNYPSDEHQMSRTRNMNNQHPTYPGSKQFHHWQTEGPPMTRHPISMVTNDINEAMGFLEESINYSPHSGQMLPEWQHAKPTTNFRTNIIDSQEAIRKYQGTRVPP